MAALLPEDATAIEETLALLDLDADALLAELTAAAAEREAAADQAVTFAVPAADLPAVEAAITRTAESLDGPNRRGWAPVALCRTFLETSDA